MPPDAAEAAPSVLTLDTSDYSKAVAFHEAGNVAACEEALLRFTAHARPPEALCLLATVYAKRKEWDRALAVMQETVAHNPYHAEAWRMMGAALTFLGRHEESGAALRRSLELGPNAPHALWNYGLWLLADGQWEEGWELYRWGSVMEGRQPRLPTPEWDGSDLTGQTLFVWSEQGYGDTFLFLRLLAAAKEWSGCARLVLEVQSPLVTLLVNQTCADFVYGRPPDLSMPYAFDAHVPITSLPRLLSARPDSIPGEVPYLCADAALVDLWRERVEAPGLKVGLCIKGSPKHTNDGQRSIPEKDFDALNAILAAPGVSCCSLHEGDAPDGVHPLANFADTAAVIANLDLVITVDTAVAHLAGAMSKPTWLMLSRSSDFRWLREREDSVWYPSFRIFRQERLGEWAGVFGRIVAELGKLATPKKKGRKAA